MYYISYWQWCHFRQGPLVFFVMQYGSETVFWPCNIFPVNFVIKRYLKKVSGLRNVIRVQITLTHKKKKQEEWKFKRIAITKKVKKLAVNMENLSESARKVCIWIDGKDIIKEINVCEWTLKCFTIMDYE